MDTNVGPPTVEKILVYLDRSSEGEAGLSYALRVSMATGAGLLLLHVVKSAPRVHPRPVDALGLEIARSEALQYLQTVAARLLADGSPVNSQAKVKIRTEIAEGRPAEQILHVADREQVDLIVLASHEAPEGTRFRMGSTAQKVIQNARQSLMVVRSAPDSLASHRPTLERVLVLLDGSIAAESSLPSALELSRTMGTEIVLGHALVRTVLPTCEPPTRRDSDMLAEFAERSRELARGYLRNIEQGLRNEGAYCRAVIKDCDSVRQGVLALGEEEDVDLVLLTSHGHTSSRLVVHGGVTQQVLMHARRPVWVVQNLHHAASQPGKTMRPAEMRIHVSGPH
jgi:nucleotide-binding universal stress UspA family protein